jgi:hypothetical protein
VCDVVKEESTPTAVPLALTTQKSLVSIATSDPTGTDSQCEWTLTSCSWLFYLSHTLTSRSCDQRSNTGSLYELQPQIILCFYWLAAELTPLWANTDQ